PGIGVDVAKTDGSGYTGQKIIGIPTRTSAELEKTSPPGTGEQLPVKGDIVLLQGPEGMLALPLGMIKHMTFKGEPRRMVAEEEFRNLLTMKLEWPGGRAGKSVDVGMAYLQKGVRWIPGYK